MAVEAKFVGGTDDYEKAEITLGSAAEPGDVLQFHDGRACVVLGSNDIASGEKATVALSGRFEVTGADTTTFLRGVELWWDESANTAAVKWGAAGDFLLGVCDEAVASGTAPKVEVVLNGKQSPVWSLRDPKGQSNTIVETLGLGLTINPGGIATAEFDAVAEAATASILSGISIPPTDEFLFVGVLNIVDDGDDAALDWDFGIANTAHATDFIGNVTEYVVVRGDGNVVNIVAASDDATTTVAPVDTTIDYTLGTPFVVWIHCADNEDIQMYIDGVNVLSGSTFKLDAATGPMKAVFMVEKSSNDTTAKIDVIDMKLIRFDDGGAS